MHESRPVSDSLLARAQHEATHQSRGILKIFLGATAGVGKTYAILEAAPVRRAAGVDVVVGWVDTHGRAETAALLHGLELLPCRAVAYRGTTLDAFDLEAALARHPTLVLVDELAHTNAPGARHPKRWQDAEELLDAGISVYTTMNVQYLESLNDVVARETILDAIWEQADEVELIGLPPDDLPQRLHEGKVYVPQQAELAIRNLFRVVFQERRWQLLWACSTRHYFHLCPRLKHHPMPDCLQGQHAPFCMGAWLPSCRLRRASCRGMHPAQCVPTRVAWSVRLQIGPPAAITS